MGGAGGTAWSRGDGSTFDTVLELATAALAAEKSKPEQEQMGTRWPPNCAKQIAGRLWAKRESPQ